jgi:glutamate-ammonia-ligase adenylyltransferase
MRRLLTGGRKKQAPEHASLAVRMTGALPRALRPGRARVTEWLSGIDRTVSGKGLAALLAAHPALAKTLDGIAVSAPYLWDLARADPARLLRLLGNDPEAELAALLAGMREGAGAAKGAAALMRVLRRLKAEAALLIALADVGGVWPVARVTAALTGPPPSQRGRQATQAVAARRRRSRGAVRLLRPCHGQDGRP